MHAPLRQCTTVLDSYGHQLASAHVLLQVAYSLIEPNTTKRYSTYATHPWVVRNVETGKRMMLNNSVVAVAAPEQKDIIIGEVPMLHWQVRSALHYRYLCDAASCIPPVI